MLLKYSSLLNFASTYEKRLDLKKRKKKYRVGDLFLISGFFRMAFLRVKVEDIHASTSG